MAANVVAAAGLNARSAREGGRMQTPAECGALGMSAELEVRVLWGP